MNGMIDSMDMNLSKLQKIVKDMKDWYAAVHGIAKSQIQLTNTFTVFPTPGAGSGGQYFLNECVCVCLCMDAHTCSQGARPTHHPLRKQEMPKLTPGPQSFSGCR